MTNETPKIEIIKEPEIDYKTSMEAILTGYRWLFWGLTLGVIIPLIIVLFGGMQLKTFGIYSMTFDTMIIIIAIWQQWIHKKMIKKKREKQEVN